MFKIWHILLSEEDTEDVTRVPLYIMYQFYCFPYSFVPYCFTSVVSSASKNQFDSKSLLLSNDMCLYNIHVHAGVWISSSLYTKIKTKQK